MAIPQTQLSIKLKGQVESGTMVSLDFNALPGSNPKALGYFVAIWQGNQIQDLSEALQTQNITTETQSGSATFENLELANLDYIIGFGVDNKNGVSICATIEVPQGSEIGQQLEGDLSTINLQSQSSNSLIAGFKTPEYNTPADNKNWIALFKGGLTANMYKGKNVVKTTMISNNTNKGAVAMNDIPGGLIRFEKYTLIYGMGLNKDGKPDFSNLVSATQFDIA